MAILFQFVLRLAFGLGVCLAVTSPRQVTSGFFRNHLYVTLGLCVLATLVAFSDTVQFDYRFALAAAVASYLGSVCWLYERSRPGLIAAGLVAIFALAGALFAEPPLLVPAEMVEVGLPLPAKVLWILTPLSSGLLLGFTLGTMFLGHWYLNTPTMQMTPLRKLLWLMIISLCLRTAVSGCGLWYTWNTDAGVVSASALFLVLRWMTGILAPFILAWMVARTLAIPNTQSATGILYVGVITTFTGELMSQLLSVQAVFPL